MGLFTLDVDGRIVQFVRPADIEDPAWGAYDGDRFLGMVYAEPNFGGGLRIIVGFPLERNVTSVALRTGADDPIRIG